MILRVILRGTTASGRGTYMCKIRLFFCVALLFSIAMTVSGQDPSNAAVASVSPQNEKYRIGYRDVVTVQVDKHPALNQSVPVSSNGTIKLFRIDNPIVAICKTEDELTEDIRVAYGEKYLRNPVVRATVSDQRSQPVAVFGAVSKPDTYYLTRRVHLLELLGMAGGPNKEAGTRLIVARSGANSVCRPADEPQNDDNINFFDLKIRDVIEGKTAFWIKPGDSVSILPADIIYVYGNVTKQGAYKITEPITLRQAIATAEGFKSAAKKDKIRVLRRRDGSAEREEIVYDLNQIDKGKVKDPYLEPNDIVAVSEDKVKSILNGFVDSLKNTIPSAIYRIP